ncbi:MAG: hypothetical protein ACC628_07420 [Pirellulaceae bacterium]
MKKTDALFLASVLGVAGAFSWMSLSHALRLRPNSIAGPSAPVNAAGEARGVDVDRLLPMLRRGDLSGREAEFYKPLPERGVTAP